MSEGTPAVLDGEVPARTAMRARLLIALATYATPALAMVLLLSAVQAVLGPGFDDQQLLQDTFVAEQGPWWVAVLVVGTVGVILPPPSLVGRIGVLLLVPALVAAHLMTWGLSPIVIGAPSTAASVLWATGWLVTVAIPVVMVVGLARLHVLDRRWWTAVVVAAVVVGVVTAAVHRERMVAKVETSSSLEVVDAPVLYDPSVPDPSRCTPEQEAAMNEVVAALPWKVVGSQPAGDVFEGICRGPTVVVQATYDDVLAGAADSLGAAGITVTSPADIGQGVTILYAVTADGTPVELAMVTDDPSDGALIIDLTSGRP